MSECNELGLVVNGIEAKLESNWNKTCYTANVSKFYVEKGYPCQQASKCHLWYVSVHFTDHNIMQWLIMQCND